MIVIIKELMWFVNIVKFVEIFSASLGWMIYSTHRYFSGVIALLLKRHYIIEFVSVFVLYFAYDFQ